MPSRRLPFKLAVTLNPLCARCAARPAAATPANNTLSAKALHEIVTNLPGEEIEVKRSDNHWAEIRAGKVNYKLVGMPSSFLSDRDGNVVLTHMGFRSKDKDKLEAAIQTLLEK